MEEVWKVERRLLEFQIVLRWTMTFVCHTRFRVVTSLEAMRTKTVLLVMTSHVVQVRATLKRLLWVYQESAVPFPVQLCQRRARE